MEVGAMTIPKAGLAPLPELARFLEPFAALVRRSESRQALERYTTGLLADLPRKTASDLGRTLPGTSGQRLQEMLTNTAWDPAAMDNQRIAMMRERASVGSGVLIVDDTGLPKKGKHSVGVTRQYSGTLGRVDNCQVLVTLHYVDHVFDWPVSAQLYLPQGWCKDSVRRKKARIPEEIAFQTKGAIALDLIEGSGLTPAAVVADAGYGDQPAFLDGLQEKGIPYVVRTPLTTTFRLADAVHADPGTEEERPWSGRGRPPKPVTLADRVAPLSAEALLGGLPEDAWRPVAWRRGSGGGALIKSCARIRVFRTRQRGRHTPVEGWLFGERPLPGRGGEAKYYLAVGCEELSLEALMERAHVRWVIERFYQDAKGELGLDDYEGRLWTGLHRHVALVMLAHSFLTLQQAYGPEVRDGPAGGDGAEPETSLPRGFPPSGTPQRGRAAARSVGRTLPAGP
jgi:SRSO17 transposase